MADELIPGAPNQTAAPAPAAKEVTPNQTAAPAPAATPPAEQTPAPVQTKDEKTGVVTFEPTGDVALDLSLEFFGKLGFTLESAELQEAGKGNFQYLEAKLAEMGEKAVGHERFMALAKEAYSRLQANETALYEERKKVVMDAVGGEETWKQIQEFVKANADPKELEEVRAALRQGGVVAKATAELLHRQYLSASGTTVEPASAVRNQATAPASGGALTRAGYLQELNALIAKVGSNRLDGSPEYTALRTKYANIK